MISFIIIGYNEGWKLSRCLKSVFETIAQNNLMNFEVVYVDSNSGDDSIERAQKFTGIKIFRITGECNPAIGRNIGARESHGNTLFFIDGDMEIMHDFLPLVYNENMGLMFDFVSGQLINYNYSSKGILQSKEEYFKHLKSDKYEFITGGLFLIKRDLWFLVSGLKNKLKVCEDLDLGLRLSKNKVFLLRKKELLAIHHTVPYNEKRRMWTLLISGRHLFRMVLLRENILNKYAWQLFIRGNYTFIILIFTLVAVAILKKFIIIFLYLASILLRTLLRSDMNLWLIIINLIYIPLREISSGLAFLFFWPKNKKEEYITIC
jgi:glycosyltransferase involved in cell wall biosynthesis